MTAPVASPPLQQNAPPIDPATLAKPVNTPSDAEIRARLRQSAAAQFAAAAQQNAELEQRAKTLGVALEIPRADGGVNRLLDITPEGEPLYVGPNNIAAADTISVDNTWPAGSVTAVTPWVTGEQNWNLNGTGQTIGLWDPSGAVRTTHEQFGSRITQRDSVLPPVAAHATWVAGTLSSAGLDRLALVNGQQFNVGNHKAF